MRLRIAVVGGIALAAVAIAAWLFPRALPIVPLELSMTRDAALTRADSFFRVHELAPPRARTAPRFDGNDSLRTFIELAGGGADSLNALVRGNDVAPFYWSVRAFVAGDPREARVDFAPDGRIIGFEQKLAEADRRPTVSADSGRRLAESALDEWIDDRADRWRLVASSYETRKTSGRVDRTYTFERTDRRIAGAPIRTEVVVAGDRPASVRPFVEIPETFRRRYTEMRSWNQLLALLALLGTGAIVIVGAILLVRYAREHQVRWKPPMVVGAVIGAMTLAAVLNEIPGSWFDYDTALSPTTFLATQLLLALLGAGFTALLVVFTLAAAEAATRRAFPQHLDWWKLWRYRGTRDVALQVGGGYAVAAIAFAYVALFYVVTRSAFGWWVPSTLLDDPNLIASPLPWITGLAISVNAAVWEEALFRALPLSLIALWVGDRGSRRSWMIAGVVASALIFGFAHSDYESWPPYSRGVEIFLDACFWAVLFLLFGILVTVIAHFVYDAVLFGIFAGAGDAPVYRVTAAIVAVALLAPAGAVLWRAVRQRGLVPAPSDARFSAWTAVADDEPARAAPRRGTSVLTARAYRLALAAAIGGLLVAVGRPPRPALGPEFTAQRAKILQTADSMLRVHGAEPRAWTRLAAVWQYDSLPEWSRFVQRHEIVPEAQRLATTYAPPAWWAVRYVRTDGTPAQRAEEWRVRILPDGTPLNVRHVIPDTARRGTADSVAVRRIAVNALVRAGIDTAVLRTADVRESARPARRDVTVIYTDTTVKLPAGAAARVRVEVAGDDPLAVRREVELPETFLRAERARGTTRAAIGGVAILLLALIVAGGALVVRRRLPLAIDDGVLGRRAGVVLVAALSALGIASAVSALRPELASYDTAEPWSTFVGTSALALVAPALFALTLVGLLLLLESLRRRVGVPMAGEAHPGRSLVRDVSVAGVGIGGIVYAAVNLDTIVASQALPRVPATALDRFVPWLAGVPDVPANAILVVAMAGIPMLVVAGLTQRRSGRLALGALLLALAGVAVWSFESGSGIDPLSLALVVGGIVVAVVATVRWGAPSAWSWAVASLAYQALASLRDSIYGTVWQERVAGALAAVVAVGLIALIVRRLTRTTEADAPGGASPTIHPSTTSEDSEASRGRA